MSERHIAECNRLGALVADLQRENAELRKRLDTPPVGRIPPEPGLTPAAKYPDLWEYHIAPSGAGPHAGNWKDKPHRLIYDLTRLAAEARDNAPKRHLPEPIGEVSAPSGTLQYKHLVRTREPRDDEVGAKLYALHDNAPKVNLPMHLREDTPPSAQCNTCGRKEWAKVAIGSPCGMTQPSGYMCVGTMQPPSITPEEHRP